MKALTDEQRQTRAMYAGRLRTPEQIERSRVYQREWARRNPGKKHTWRKNNPELAREASRKSMERWRLADPERYRAKARRSKGYPEPTRPEPTVCELCGYPSVDGKALHLDHCHATGVFRGWLCTNCNRGLGHFRDNPELLRKAASYLEASK